MRALVLVGITVLSIIPASTALAQRVSVPPPRIAISAVRHSYVGVIQQQGRVQLTPDGANPTGVSPWHSYVGVQQQQGRVILTPDGKTRHRGR
jgi:hypothetical protein